MEVLSRGRAVSNNDVSLFQNVSVSLISGSIGGVTQLKESLQSGGGVLGTIAVIAVRQEHDQSILNVPLGLSRDDFSINHNLGSIGKISELSFPETESVGVGLGVTILESKDSVLGQVRASSDEVSDATSVGDDRVDRDVRAISVLVEDVGVSVGESSSFNILSRKADVVTFVNQSGESEGFSLSPGDSFASLNSSRSVPVNVSH